MKHSDCNTYFWGITENDYINTIKGLYKTKDEKYYGFTVYPPDLISNIHDLKWRLARRGDTLINIWDDKQQQFKTVSLKKLLESKDDKNVL